MRLRPLAITLLLAPALPMAGCAEPTSLLVPRFQVGDAAVYLHVDFVAYEVRVERLLNASYHGVSRQVLEVSYRPQRHAGGVWLYRIDPATGYTVERTSLCWEGDAPCASGDYQTRFFGRSMVPWGFGASMFQGMRIEEGDTFQRSFTLGNTVLPVDYHVVDVRRSEGQRIAIINATTPVRPLGADPFHAFTGQFVVSAASPFVMGFRPPKVEERWDEFGGVQLGSWTPGAGSTLLLPPAGLVPADPLPAIVPPRPGPSGAWPGEESLLSLHGASIREFREAARDEIGEGQVLGVHVWPPPGAATSPREQVMVFRVGGPEWERVLRVTRADSTDLLGNPQRSYGVSETEYRRLERQAQPLGAVVPLDALLKSWGSVGPQEVVLSTRLSYNDPGPTLSRTTGEPSSELAGREDSLRTRFEVETRTGRILYEAGRLPPGVDWPWMGAS